MPNQAQQLEMAKNQLKAITRKRDVTAEGVVELKTAAGELKHYIEKMAEIVEAADSDALNLSTVIENALLRFFTYTLIHDEAALADLNTQIDALQSAIDQVERANSSPIVGATVIPPTNPRGPGQFRPRGSK